ncbi:MAG: SurA N-terminal domain-containing protein [Myxococcota bacterium]
MMRVLLALAMLVVTTVSARADVIERVVATINEDAIFLSELRRRATPFLEQVMSQPTQESRMAALRQLYSELLERLIDEELFQQAAQRLQVRVTSRDVQRAVQNVIQQNGLSEEEFWQAVEAQGYTEAQYRSDLRRQLLRLKVLNQRVRGRVNITEADVRQIYEQRVRQANRRLRFRTSQVFFPIEDSSATAVAQARAAAEAVRREVSADNFGQAIDTYGGGELGWLRQGDLSPDMEEVLLAMDAGEVSDPVRSDNGFHIFLLHERERGGANIPSYDDLKEQIYQEMLGRAMERQEAAFLQELRRNAIVSRRL